MAARNIDLSNDQIPEDCTKSVVYLMGSSKTDKFEKWLKRYPPSKVTKEDGFTWIYVKNVEKEVEYAGDGKKDLEGLCKSWKEHQKSQLPVNYETLKELAIKHNTTTGKWILFTDSGGKVDHLWSLMAATVAAYDNPCYTAKVSAFDKDINHVICIYNKDFTNMDKVLESEKAIRRMGIKCKLQYKPDVFTYLDIYAKNKWNLKPFIMTSQYNLLTQSSIIENVM
ncbi:UPF0696 protein C11orf68 homolog [Ruditapes philippinarum]|uniref:UPF0696 protein C11orf68 homolog n=1 Tax=Ruditapes philippinarum TaxID=129788 RepID=UPI00295C0C5C|nr:UPF0696 protein C11orf68 homolog [Ruditapes philippinarum]